LSSEFVKVVLWFINIKLIHMITSIVKNHLPGAVSRKGSGIVHESNSAFFAAQQSKTFAQQNSVTTK
jgi:hypothetical protein